MKSALHLRGLGMAYGRRALFHAVTLRIAPGEILAVTGANGAGKSTLLKIVAGLLRPEEGRVEFEGRRGYAAPDAQLYSELTGDENLRFFAHLRGLPESAEADAWTAVGLPRGRGRDLVSSYSSGMRQRLKLAVSLLGAPPLLIWDEPTATLDTAGGQRVEDILAEHRNRGGIAVLATNDAGEAARWGNHCVRIGE